jgi:hypothetical protein
MRSRVVDRQRDDFAIEAEITPVRAEGERPRVVGLGRSASALTTGAGTRDASARRLVLGTTGSALPPDWCQDDQALESLRAREQIVSLEVCVPIVGIRDLGTPAKERVSFVEEQHHPGALGRIEDPAEVLLRLANLLGDDAGQVDRVEVAGRSSSSLRRSTLGASCPWQ